MARRGMALQRVPLLKPEEVLHSTASLLQVVAGEQHGILIARALEVPVAVALSARVARGTRQQQLPRKVRREVLARLPVGRRTQLAAAVAQAAPVRTSRLPTFPAQGVWACPQALQAPALSTVVAAAVVFMATSLVRRLCLVRVAQAAEGLATGFSRQRARRRFRLARALVEVVPMGSVAVAAALGDRIRPILQLESEALVETVAMALS